MSTSPRRSSAWVLRGPWIPRARSVRAACVASALLAAATPATGFQIATSGPLAPSARASQAQNFDHVWSQVALTSFGSVSAWSAGQNVHLRRFDRELQPLSDDELVNATFSAGVQDEPAVCTSTAGTFLVAWSERHGFDGEQMGIFARAYSAQGAPLATEFQVNQGWQASQWRPRIAAAPGGRFVVSWSGDWDGDSFFRVLDAHGVPLTGDVAVNQFEFDAQVDPDAAVSPSGVVLVAFVDFSSHGNVGTHLNVWGRRFDLTGQALGDEFPLASVWRDGDQRLPRVAADAHGNFTVVWQSELVDGSSTAIVARRFASSGAALGPEFQVNSTTTGFQGEARVACDAAGRSVIAWEDHSRAHARIVLRRFDAAGIALGPEEVVSDAAFACARPELALARLGDELCVSYDAFNGVDVDVRLRRFAITSGPHVFGVGKPSSAGCTPRITWSGVASATATTPFVIGAEDLPYQRFGLLFYGHATSFTPFQGGTRYVASPLRTATQQGGGNALAGPCSGTFALDFGARIQSGVDPLLSPGRTVVAQYSYRDPGDPAGFGTGLSNAVRFAIQP